MYFVSTESRLIYLLLDVLKEKFSDKADVTWENGHLFIKFKDDAGFKKEEDFLSKEEIEMGVVGGGLTLALDGCKLEIVVKEIKEE